MNILRNTGLPWGFSKFDRYYAVVFVCLFVSGCATFSSENPNNENLAAQNNASSKDIFALSQKAQIAYTESRIIEAVQLYQQVVERVPADSDAWFRLGNAYAQQGAYERAIHAYETSLVNDSQQPKAWFNLSTAYLLNAQAAMRESFNRMRANDPARTLVDVRLLAIEQLLHGRLEESTTQGLRTAQ